MQDVDFTVREIRPRSAMAKVAFNKTTLFTSKLDLNLRKKLFVVKRYIWSTALYRPDNWTLRKVDKNYPEIFEMWYWRRTEISWTERVKNKEALYTAKEERGNLRTIKRMKANWIGHILRIHCLLKHVTEGKIEGMGRRGRRRKQQLDVVMEKRRHWNLKQEGLDPTL
jgi:hypothetical protein